MTTLHLTKNTVINKIGQKPSRQLEFHFCNWSLGLDWHLYYLFLITILHFLHSQQAAQHVLLGSLSGGVTHTFIPINYGSFVILPVLSCSFPLTLIIGCRATKRCYNGSSALDTPFYTVKKLSGFLLLAWMNHPVQHSHFSAC